jgi:perosamine synthetase
VKAALDKLAIEGGSPVRGALLPYGRPAIDENDIAAVGAVMRTGWLTTGPKVAEFEAAFAAAIGGGEAVAVANGTAALHCAAHAAGIGPGDEVIVPALTFAASANCVRYLGGTVVFADVRADTLNVDPAQVASLVTPRTKAVIAVDYAGQPADLDPLLELCRARNLILIEDASHALRATYRSQAVGSIADFTTFSLHPVKLMTTGEGGMVTTRITAAAMRMRAFRNHGISADHRERGELGSWQYDIADLGFNYRLSDMQCALGLSQLRNVDRWLERRRDIAARYDAALASIPAIARPVVLADREPAWHLYVVRLDLDALSVGREQVFRAMRAENIGVNVHYIPVPWLGYYQRLGYGKGRWPVAEEAYGRILTLPLFPEMTDRDVSDVVRALEKVVARYAA